MAKADLSDNDKQDIKDLVDEGFQSQKDYEESQVDPDPDWIKDMDKKKPSVPALVTKDIVMPAVSAEQAVQAWQNYQELKSKIVEPNDIQIIKNEKFLKKSYWRKIATFFNLSVTVIEERKEQLGKTFVWHFICKAIAPNGRYSIGTGSCDAYEKAKLIKGTYKTYNRFSKKWEAAHPNSIHNIRSTAETRAFNRAVSNLVGGGEVSAEEVDITYQDQYNGKSKK